MKESYSKDPASHTDPESCGTVREGRFEALTGETTGEVLSHEIHKTRLPTLLSEAEGNNPEGATASPEGSRRGRRPSACGDASCIGTGRPRNPARRDGDTQRDVKAARPKTSMDDAGESESVVVAMKPPNKMPSLLAWPTEEVVEPRTDAKRNPPQGATSRTQSRNHDVPCDLQRVRQRALKDKVLQGAVISPLLGNVYLHYALDLWVQHWRKRHARGEVIVVRYADDFVIGCLTV